MSNPFSISFGIEPTMLISRVTATDAVLETFLAERPMNQISMFTGVRGSGKTVFLTETANRFRERDDWIVIDLNPERDLLQALAAKLCSRKDLYTLFESARLNLSLFGLGIEIDGEPPISDIEAAVSRMLQHIKKAGKRVLVTIDEVTNNEHMKIFAASFQMFLREGMPLFLLMTGLYENIDNLQNENSLTFLFRAPKIPMEPLNIGAMAAQYEKSLSVDRETAVKMARLTKGYPFAFQVLGYLCYQKHCGYQAVLPDFELYINEYVYRKLWSELSQKDKMVMYGIAQCPSGRIREIREQLNLTTNEFNPYRQRLIRKGLISGEERGIVKMTLPLFDRYVLENYIE